MNRASSSIRPWIIVGLLTLLMMVNFIDKVSFGLAATELVDHFGLTVSQYGWINSAFFAMFSLTALAVGFIADRISTRWIIAGMVALWGVSQISIVFANGFILLLLCRMLLGAAEGPTVPMINHSAYSWLRDRDRSLASSIMTSGGSIGVLVGAPLVTFLIIQHGWKSAFVVTGIISLGFSLVWLLIGREGPHSSKSASAEEVPQYDAAQSREIYWKTVKTGTFIASVVAAFSAYWVIGNALAFKPMYLQKVLGLSASGVAQVTMATQVFTIVVAYLAQGLLTRWLLSRGVSSRLARGVLGGVCLILSACAHFAFVLVPNMPLQMALICLTHISSAMFAISLTVCAEITPTSHRGRILSTYGMLYPLAGVIAPVVTGYLASSFGEVAGLRTAWIVSGVIVLCGGVAATLFIRPDRDKLRVSFGEDSENPIAGCEIASSNASSGRSASRTWISSVRQ